MGVRCFWLEPTGERQVVLRRYTQDHQDGWTCAEGWHEARSEVVAVEPDVRDDEGYSVARDEWDPDDPRWPVECAEGCGYRFTETDSKQTFTSALYRDDQGRTYTLHDAPPGAMWDATWMPFSRGPDGRCIVVVTPSGRQWMIDSRARNCTLPDDADHFCWCRHGEPPNLTVDKRPEPGTKTCSAGGGSIQSGDYHGFLRNGEFT